MAKPASPLSAAVNKLEEFYGPPAPAFPEKAFDIILWENVAYLADDAERRQAFEALRSKIGTQPDQIMAASKADLQSVTSHGIMPDRFVTKLRKAALLALEVFEGDVESVVHQDPPEAKRALRKFPSIGEPAAEKILLFTGQQAFLAPDSNALRVLVRLGISPERKNHAATYAAAREVSQKQLGDDKASHLAAHQLLRRHGKETCKRSKPACDTCPLSASCNHFAAQ